MSRKSPRRRARTFQAEEQPVGEGVGGRESAGGEREDDTFQEMKAGWFG